MGTHCFPEATILSLEAELRESRGIIDLLKDRLSSVRLENRKLKHMLKQDQGINHEALRLIEQDLRHARSIFDNMMGVKEAKP